MLPAAPLMCPAVATNIILCGRLAAGITPHSADVSGRQALAQDDVRRHRRS